MPSLQVTGVRLYHGAGSSHSHISSSDGNTHTGSSNSQRLDGRAPLAGDDLHQLEAAVVELDVSGVVVLCVDLTGPERTAVLRLDTHTQ